MKHPFVYYLFVTIFSHNLLALSGTIKRSLSDPTIISSVQSAYEKDRFSAEIGKRASVMQELETICRNDLAVQKAECIEIASNCALHNKKDGCNLIECIAEMHALGIKEAGPSEVAINPGDQIIGVAAIGLHTLGFGIMNSIIKEMHIDTTGPCPFVTHRSNFQDALLEQTPQYHHSLSSLLKNQHIKAATHICRKSLAESLAELLPEQYSAMISFENWHIPSVFRWIKEIKKIDDITLLNQFNCGTGIILIVSPRHVQAIIEEISSHGYYASTIGSVIKKGKEKIAVQSGTSLKSSRDRILVMGDDAIEQALSFKLAQSPYLEIVCAAPGNPGTAHNDRIKNIAINPVHSIALIAYAQKNGIDMIIAGPDMAYAPSVLSLCKQKGIRCLGPTTQTRNILKHITFKQELKNRTIKTDPFLIFDEKELASIHVMRKNCPLSIASNNNNYPHISMNAQEAQAALSSEFKEAQQLIISELSEGELIHQSFFIDGATYAHLVTSQVEYHKYECDKGTYTRGMGAICPAPSINDTVSSKLETEFVKPIIQLLAEKNALYSGFITFIFTKSGKNDIHLSEVLPTLSSYNAQAMALKLQTDFYTICHTICNHQLSEIPLSIDPRPVLTVTLLNEERTAEKSIIGIDLKTDSDVILFHNETNMRADKVTTNGFYVLSASAIGTTLQEARSKVYALVKNIYWPGIHYRNDIGYKAIVG